MCDSLLAVKADTADGVAVFAKNSDRPPNEGQYLKYVPAEDHPVNSRVKCTYIEIPQATHTNAVLLSKPYWIWGAEMGVNDKKVVIGNEAVFPKVPTEKNTKLIGMDLVRLGLERGNTARGALEVMIALLEEFGQGGSCTTTCEPYYSSFLIADPDDAWVLETAGKWYAAKHVTRSDSISNYLTIEADYELVSQGLAEHAVKMGWAKSVKDFKFGDAYNSFLTTKLIGGPRRRAVTMQKLSEGKGRIDVPYMMSILRAHLPDGGRGKNWQPQHSVLLGTDVCMHSGFGIIRDSNTAGSLVVHLDKKRPTIFVTGTASPCTSVFKPVWMDASFPDLGPAPTDEFDPNSLFWRHELLHRATVQDYEARIATYAAELAALELEFVEGGLAIAGGSAKKRAKYSAECFAKAAAIEPEWYERVLQVPAQPKGAMIYNYAWDTYNKQAKMPKL
ncbi:MAG: peptidase U34 [Anaerolineales bacterium]|nr:peptidase U34 [Anaerolineae bacterium]PWB70696.1 MAG: peptidase U34 [Anaerolineales bacterium]